MTLQVKALAPEPDGLSVIPETHIHIVQYGMHEPTHISPLTHNNK